MAKRSAPRHARRRKRRGMGAVAGQKADAAAAAAAGTRTPAAAGGNDPPAGTARAPAAAQAASSRQSARARREAARAATRFGDALTVGERPQPPWHPLPLAELLILVGMIAIVVGVTRKQSGVPVILVGVGAVLIGTLEFTIREHMSGYRSHATLLATVPTAALHSGLAVALLAAGAPSPSWVVAPLLIDVPVFVVAYRWLRARFREARHERILAAGR